MTKKDKKDLQRQWLSDLYPTFERVAQAIIVDSVTVAEEAVSNALEIVLKSVEKGNTAGNKTEFAGYCRKVVRGCAMKTYSTYEGDVRSDAAVHRATFVMRPDRRRTSIPDLGSFDGDYDHYTRAETIESPETE